MTFHTISIEREGVEDIAVNVQLDDSDPESMRANESAMVLADIPAYGVDGVESGVILFKKGSWIDLTDAEMKRAEDECEEKLFNSLSNQQRRAIDSERYRDSMGYE